MDATTVPSIPPSLSSPSDSSSPLPAPPNNRLHSTKKNKLGLTIRTSPSVAQPQAFNMDAYYNNVIISQQLKIEAKALDAREDALVAREIELEKKEAVVERYTASSGKELAKTQRQLARVQREIAELQELERGAAVLEQGGGSGDREGVVKQEEGTEGGENKGATREALPLSTTQLHDSAIAMLKRERELDSYYQKTIDTSLVERLFSTFSLPADADRAFGISGLSVDEKPSEDNEKHAGTQKPDLLAEMDKSPSTQVYYLQTADYSRNQRVDGTVDGLSSGRQQRNDSLASYTMDMPRSYTKAGAVPRPAINAPPKDKRSENLKATLRKLAELYPEKKVTRSKPMSNSLNPLVVAAREMGASTSTTEKKTRFAATNEKEEGESSHTVANLETKASESDVQVQQTPEQSKKASLAPNDISSEVSPPQPNPASASANPPEASP